MSSGLADSRRSALVVIDVQPSFLGPIVGAEQVVARTRFLVESAHLLGVPVLATEQYATRMGPTEESIAALLGHGAIDKMSFSCVGSPEFVAAWERTGRTQAVLCGIETPICVNQTAHHLLERGAEVVLAADAIGGRSEDAHRSALDRMARRGAILGHSESIVYEWMGSAEHPQFREVLRLVKGLTSP